MQEFHTWNGQGSSRLNEIAAHLRSGSKPEPVTVRTLLDWFHAQRRGVHIVAEIRDALDDAGLITIPDFEGAYFDGYIEFALPDSQQASTSEDVPIVELSDHVSEAEIDPIFRIRILPSANTKPISVIPNQSITEAITIMLTNDFSQLPVLSGEGHVLGMVTWESIGSRLALGVECSSVNECMERSHVIASTTPLFQAITVIVTNQCVFVEDERGIICGIVTTSDLSFQFKQLAEPFLILGEIENQVRRLISRRGKFPKEQIRQYCRSFGNREVNDVSDMMFGEYIRLLRDEEAWDRISLPVDRRLLSKNSIEFDKLETILCTLALIP